MLKRLRNGLVIVLLVAVTVRIVWWAVEPIVDAAIPALIPAVIGVSVAGALYHRKRRW
jgi:tryptophan-rich sensory protein